MPNPQLTDYITAERAIGISKEEIVAALLGVGWAAGDVELAFAAVEKAAALAAEPVVPVPATETARPVQQVEPEVSVMVPPENDLIERPERPLTTITEQPVVPMTTPVEAPKAMEAAPLGMKVYGGSGGLARGSGASIVSEKIVSPSTSPLDSISVPASGPVSVPVSTPVATAPAAVVMTPPTQAQATTAHPSPEPVAIRKSRAGAILTGITVIALLLGGTAYAYVEKLAFFSRPPYQADNLISGLMAATANMRQASYSVSASLAVESRDADAVPFTITYSNPQERVLRYDRDAERADEVRAILSALEGVTAYPTTLEGLTLTAFSRGVPDALDPTGVPYVYQTTEDGFELTVTFETPEAIEVMQVLRADGDAATRIEGKTVTFTKDSPTYVYLSGTPPEPFFISAQEAFTFIPADFSGTVSATARADWSGAERSAWEFMVTAVGGSEDLSYRLNLEARKKDGVYYGRINNIPDPFGMLSALKGKWVRVHASEESPDAFSFESMVFNSIPKLEEAYLKQRSEVVAVLRTAARIADEEQVVVFAEEPRAERIAGQMLYRYRLVPQKESIARFVKRLYDEEPRARTVFPALDSILGEIGTPEFEQLFAYYKENVTQTLWVDAKGNPVHIEYAVRVVPADAATAFVDKQVRLVFKLSYRDVDEPIDIQVPEGARPLSELLSGLESSVGVGSDAVVKANLSTISVQAELYYDRTQGYGPASTSCKEGFFSESVVTEAIASVEKTGSTLECASGPAAWAVQAALPSTDGTTYWCVDSAGRKQIATEALGAALACVR